MQKVSVWDIPTRLFHWLLAILVITAYFTGGEDEGGLYNIHVAAGYGIGLLIMFRVVWGVIGTRYARFSDFTPGPHSLAQYIGGLVRGQPPTYLGHNPLGGLNIFLMLGVLIGVVWTGLAMFSGGEEELHEVLANVILILVGLHLVGVVVDSILTRENLTLAMLTGRKHPPTPTELSEGSKQRPPEDRNARGGFGRFALAAGVTACMAWGLSTVTPFLAWPPPEAEEHEHELGEHGDGGYRSHEAGEWDHDGDYDD